MGGDGIAYQLRSATAQDRAFLNEMARAACTLAGRPLPPADDPDVVALLPDAEDAAMVAQLPDGRPLGAAWWVVREPPLARRRDDEQLPELAIAVVEEERGKGIGGALVEALAEKAAAHFSALTLNVHLLSPAVRLYARHGFQVAGQGRGRFGVAMIRSLDA